MQLDARHSVLSVLVVGYLSSKSDQSFAAEFTSCLTEDDTSGCYIYTYLKLKHMYICMIIKIVVVVYDSCYWFTLRGSFLNQISTKLLFPPSLRSNVTFDQKTTAI